MKETYELLLEIGCEEIPSRFMEGALTQLRNEAATLLAENRLEHGTIKTLGTPRRLILSVKELVDCQPDLIETVKGPPVDRAYDEQGQPTKALDGFLRGHNASLDHIEEEIIKEARYIVLRKDVPGQKTAAILPVILPQLIQKINFPRPMYWKSKEVRFARPIRWILALYQNKAVKFDYADITSDRLTYGHRFLAAGPFKINNPEHYFKVMEQSFVILDPDRRRKMIQEQLVSTAAQKGGEALVDPGLLEEVIYLVEYPVAVEGTYDETYLDLPKEVLVTTMQHHQRYFPLANKNKDSLLPSFIGISNNRAHPNISKGYAKVLQARLADARFFFDEDRKVPLVKYNEQLSSVIFLESLGTLEEKRKRLVELAARLGENLNLLADQVETVKRTAHLCKADLVTSMVKEFTELQGVMGREYARLSGEEETVAVGIYEHYLPRFTGDQIPSTLEGALVSLADRVDTLAGCFAIGIQPTGSQDPYALRRQAQGAVAILLGQKIDLPLDRYIDLGLQSLQTTLKLDDEKVEEICSNLKEFFIQRIRFVFQERKMSHEIIEAVLAVPFDTIFELFERASVLEEYLQGPLLDDVITAYNRVANLAQKSAGDKVDENLLQEKAEQELFALLQEVEQRLTKKLEYSCILEELQSLKARVDDFFDQVMVMVEDSEVRQNRLNLLYRIKSLFNRLADFSKLQTP